MNSQPLLGDDIQSCAMETVSMSEDCIPRYPLMSKHGDKTIKEAKEKEEKDLGGGDAAGAQCAARDENEGYTTE